MTNREKYDHAFRDAFELDDDTDVTTLKYRGIPAWDSVGHMGLVACVEEAFDVTIETDDMIDFSSYDFGLDMLRRYGIEI